MMRLAARMRRLAAALALLLLACLATTARADSFYVTGAGGVPLAVTTAGPKDAPPILFLHGIGLGAAAFDPQFHSDLAKHFRLVAFDLRGHGQSGKPWAKAAYTDPALWAGDVERVIAATGIRRPVIVAWSYGTLVAADYLREAGPAGISGLVLISAQGGLAARPKPTTPPDPKVLAELERYHKLVEMPSLAAQHEAQAIILPMLVHQDPGGNWLANARKLEGEVPAYAQVGLRAQSAANSDLASHLQALPMMLTYGHYDGAMSPAIVKAMQQAYPQLEVHCFAHSGHSLFAENPKKFNVLLAKFVTRNWKDKP